MSNVPTRDSGERLCLGMQAVIKTWAAEMENRGRERVRQASGMSPLAASAVLHFLLGIFRYRREPQEAV